VLTLRDKPYRYRVFWKLGRVAAKWIPGFHISVRLIWRLIGSVKFRVAYRNACRRGNVYLHIGAGPIRIDGWLNTDISPLAPLFLDATHRFPIKDNSISHIFNEHFIEHIPRHAAIAFLQDSFRILQPGGIRRISIPDVEALTRAYLNNPEHTRLMNERNKRLGSRYNSYPIDILNTTFREWGHICLYDFQTLQQLLNSVGFQNITPCKVGESRHSALSGIEQHDVGSIEDEFTCVVEATKPPL